MCLTRCQGVLVPGSGPVPGRGGLVGGAGHQGTTGTKRGWDAAIGYRRSLYDGDAFPADDPSVMTDPRNRPTRSATT